MMGVQMAPAGSLDTLKGRVTNSPAPNCVTLHSLGK
ncbi:hypothetical protein Thal_1577 [Thermocrinis albus DSM 14484]|uniref:Uncharacterized protein n=1 Tax=Thermocrinis albus (strain DSM 14484 / JCM 11386 / HI 11/12) TaxID=638303 RepID=D3SN75_THEAH|nr:hypothetical protein Thal_1577 [Thermocrinis albus DSM 14484]